MALSTTQQASLDALRKKGLTDQEIGQKTAQFANQTGQQGALNTLISNIGGMQNNPNNVIQPDSTISKGQGTSSVQIPQGVSYQDMTPAERAQYETVYGGPPKPTVATSKTPVVDLGTDGKPVTTDSNNLEYNEKNLNDALVQNSVDATKLTDAQKKIIAQAKIDMIKTGKSLGDLFKTSTTTGTTTTTSTNPVEDVLKGQKTEAEKQLESAKQSETDKNKTLLDSYDKDATARKNAQAIDLQNSYNRASENQRRILAASGVVNSSYGAQAIGDIDKQYTAQQQALNTKFDLERQIYQAKLQGESDDKIKALQTNINEINKNIAESQLNVAQKIADLKEKTKLSNADALKLFVNSLDDQSKKDLASKYDEKLSEKLGYAVDVYGKPLVDANGNKMSFAVKSVDADAINAYAQQIAKGTIELSSVPEALRNKVIIAVGTKSNQTNVNTADRIKALSILKKAGLASNEIDENMVSFLAAQISTKGETAVKNEYTPEKVKELKDTTIEGNQKLLDDIRGDVKSYADIKNSYTSMQSVFNDFMRKPQAEKDKSRGAVEQALGVMFQKMLDPGSVVREGEFDRTTLAQGLPSAASGWWQKLSTGGLGLTDQTLEQLVKVANTLYGTAQNNIDDIKESYQSTAADLGADPEFVKKYFENKVGGSSFGKDEMDEIKSLKLGGSSINESGKMTSNSGKSFNINFNGAGQAAGTTEIPTTGFTSSLNLKRTGNNVAKDTNNPGNITADSIPEDKREEYGQRIGATGTYRSPNGRIYYVFPDINSGKEALVKDIQAKISGNSKRISKDAPLNEFVRVYTGNYNPGYLNTLIKVTKATSSTPISQINPVLLTEAIMKAEGFTS